MKTAAFAKTIIDLNGPSERVELGLLTVMTPLWVTVYPAIGFETLNSYCGITLIGASFFCFLHFLHLSNCHFTFEEGGIRLPGIDHRLIPYANFKRIYLKRQFLLAVEFVPKGWRKRSGQEEQQVQQLFEIRHLTENGASQLCAMLHSKLGTCDISQEVGAKLGDWKPRTIKLIWWMRPLELISEAILKVTRNSNLVGKCWFTLWIVLALFAYPFGIACLVDPHGAAQLVSSVAQHCPSPVKEWLLWRISAEFRDQSVEQDRQFRSFLWGTSQGHLWLLAYLGLLVAIAGILKTLVTNLKRGFQQSDSND